MGIETHVSSMHAEDAGEFRYSASFGVSSCMYSTGVCCTGPLGSSCLISSARGTALREDELSPSDDFPSYGLRLPRLSAAATSMVCLG